MLSSRPRFIPHLPADLLADTQLTGIRQTVDHCMNNAQYKQKLNNHGIQAGYDIASLQDIQKLPFTSIDDLCSGYPLPLLCVPQKDIIRIHASSGTTGKRKILPYTKKDLEMFSLQMARCYELAGLTTEDRVQVAVGYGLWTAGAGFQLGSEYFGAMTIPIGAGNIDMHIQFLIDMQSTCLGSTASMALLLAEEIEQRNLRDKIALKKVIFGAEPHSLKMRETFEKKLGIEKSYDIGGMTEMYGPGTSINCDEKAGLHYWGDLFYYEIIDPKTLLPVPEGEVGELVVTSLCKEATPLIRYRTHDLTRLIPEKCQCGRELPRHGHIRGRSDDMIIFRGVNIYPGQIQAILNQFSEFNGEYNIILNREHALDSMIIQLELTENASNDESLTAAISKALHKKIMARVDVKLLPPKSLPRTASKTKRIIDNRLN